MAFDIADCHAKQFVADFEQLFCVADTSLRACLDIVAGGSLIALCHQRLKCYQPLWCFVTGLEEKMSPSLPGLRSSPLLF